MFRSSFEKNLENATSHLHLEPEWPSILLICDEINQKDVTPKTAFAAIKKKMNSPNPHSACYALLVLESVVKNCGAPMHDEIFTSENCQWFSNFLEQTPYKNVRQKMLELVQAWAYAFRSTDKYQSIKDTMTILKAKGHTFPELKEADAMFTADTAPNWADGKVCHRCRVEFTFTNRKHHCRNCGQVFCGQCTAKQCPLPKYGIEKDVRVCDGCFTMLQRPNSQPAVKSVENDLPAEYLNSSLAQQVQTPPRKTEQELKEEEELQLALALSQSEAEQKKQQEQHKSFVATTYRAQQRSPSPEAVPPSKEFNQEEVNPDLAKYLNRTYWEQRKVSDSPMASPSAPSPMPTPQPQQQHQQQQSQQQQQQQQPVLPKSADEEQIDEFAANMRTQVEIFVNRMKSNSSRGRSIANDSSVQTLFMTLTSLHSQQLSYIKEMDDKRMWYEQLQDKLVQIKDSRAALDVLRQEHAEKLRRMAEEQERQRQIQMAQKLEIMRKKKQEYLQYQRQLALQRIQEQEREMQLRQEQQKAQYRMGQTAFPFMATNTMTTTTSSPPHQMGNVYNSYGYNPNSPGPLPGAQYNSMVAPMPTGPSSLPGMYAPGMQPSMQNTNHQHSVMMHGQMPAGMLPSGNAMAMGVPGVAHGGETSAPNNPNALPPAHQPQQLQQAPQQQQQQQQQPQLQVPPTQPNGGQQSQAITQPNSTLGHVMLHQQNVVQNNTPLPTIQQNVPTNTSAPQIAGASEPSQSVAEAPSAAEEPPTAELISFD